MQPLRRTIRSDCVTSCAREVLDASPSLFWYIRLHMRKQRKGLSVPQFRTLVKVRNEPAASLSAVAEHLGASLPTASRIVTKLVAKGLLSRSESANDRRQLVLQLTNSGRMVVATALASTQAHMEAELARISSAKRDHVRQAMRILKELFESAGFPGSRLRSRMPEMARRVPAVRKRDTHNGHLSRQL